jgi:SAM-dependent methyltransferase
VKPIGWNDPRTARAYERFCNRHRRYDDANAALVAHADLRPGLRVLDLAAGTGRTAEATLPHLGDDGRVWCVETAAAMRTLGAKRVSDARVIWLDELPNTDGDACGFDRILCGAGIWQLTPLDETMRRLSSLLSCGGALCFNIPSIYLCEPDEPGRGRDPLLLELAANITRSVTAINATFDASARLPASVAEVSALLSEVGLRSDCWTFRTRLTQKAYRDWLSIPVVSEGFFAGLSPRERERRLNAAYQQTDRASWRWEGWTGWTAWRDQ